MPDGITVTLSDCLPPAHTIHQNHFMQLAFIVQGCQQRIADGQLHNIWDIASFRSDSGVRLMRPSSGETVITWTYCRLPC